jgi:DNA-binding MarR family transcriptional regulator
MNDVVPGVLSREVVGTLHAIEGRLEAALDPLGLSLAKFGLLSRLVASDEPLPLRRLAEECACVRSNITQLVDRLESDHLVRRTDDPKDRRSILAELTPEGRARHAAGLGALQAAEKELFAPLPERQRKQFIEMLRSLRDCP